MLTNDVVTRRTGRWEPDDAPRTGRGWRLLGILSIVMSVILVIASLGAYSFYRRLDGNIEREKVGGRLGPRPAKLNNSVNILLMGSDSRDGENRKLGGSVGGGGSDTTILLHISPGGDKAVGISFPRDSMVQIPTCEKSDGGTVPGRLGMLNSAYALAGPVCTWKTIEKLTQIKIDHYMEVDMAGFIRVVDALDGVEVCVPKAINDRKAHLDLKAGRQTVRGEQALGYVRTRSGGLGDGSDLSRIKRQQAFMGSVVKKATSKGVLTDPGKTYGFLDAITKAIKADDRLTVSVMRQLAGSLKGMSAGKVRFVTVPVVAYPADKNRVIFDPARSPSLFDAIRTDNSLPPASPKPSSSSKPEQAGTTTPKPKPKDVKVVIYNTTKVDGLAARTADRLKREGYQVTKVGSLKAAASKTQILYGTGARPAAEVLAGTVPGPKPTAGPSARPGLVYLVIGKDGVKFKGAGSAIPKITGEIRADRDVCKAT
ncbi:LCP family protein [Spirillospora sp. NPDC047279]|uniref:LCP family protein n=1 Tax=Spirillospora sp. NPDC047279 TaxID=3155478 RepID=UPI003408218E